MLAQVEKSNRLRAGWLGDWTFFGLCIDGVAGPDLDEVGHVAAHHVLHQDGLRLVNQVGQDPEGGPGASKLFPSNLWPHPEADL